MVPQFKAKASFEMLQRFLKNEPLKAYNPKAKAPQHVLDHEETKVFVQ